MNKKIIHGLHNMFYFHAVFLLFLFVGICPLQYSFSFLAVFFRKVLAIVTKCSVLVAGVLNPVQYEPA